MLIGTYVKQGSYVTVAVESGPSGPAPARVVLERSERPGSSSAAVACELRSFAEALRHAEALVLARGGWLGAEAEAVAGSPVEPAVAGAARAAARGRARGRGGRVSVRPGVLREAAARRGGASRRGRLGASPP